LTAVALVLGGCASYAPKPLPPGVSLVPGAAPAPTGQTATTPAGALSLDQVAALAVRNDPDLKAKRRKLGVAQAQRFAAGLFPDPQLSASLDHPTSSGPGLVDAFGLGVGYDVVPLITHGAHVQGERAATRQARLQLLWETWQVRQQARTLAVHFAGEARRLALLRRMRDLYRERYHHSAAALAHGNLNLDVAGTDLTALLDAQGQIDQLEQTHNDTDHTLRGLLGLAPAASLAVALPKAPSPLGAAVLRTRLADLSRRRPDLLALQAGYHSQEAKVRAAVLAQFPSLSLGLNRARDTGSVYTNGLSIGVNLPLFSGNRGAIAVARATRAQLRAEYQARLDQAALDIDKLERLQDLLRVQTGRLDRYLPTLGKLVEQARAGYRRHDIDALTFLNLETTWTGKRLARIQARQSLWETRIALETLLALPDAGTPAAENHR
jgi:outer membrane protein TolC